ncbi:MAG: hypothetical protein WCD86_10765 [Ktedonobacteraceae bacterium]
MIHTFVSSVLKGKVVLVVLMSLAVVGGATVMAASASTGTNLVQTLIGSMDTRTPSSHTTPRATGVAEACPGLPEAQQLAAHFSLNTDRTSDDILALCSLHLGTFKGTTSTGAVITSNRVFGYGEISDLLTYAQYLAAHDRANAGGKLTTDNTRSYLAQALHTCGATAIETCLKARIPGFPSGKNGNPTSPPTPGHGKPTSTPTPPGWKPTSTPTPGGGKPTSTPTPHQ